MKYNIIKHESYKDSVRKQRFGGWAGQTTPPEATGEGDEPETM